MLKKISKLGTALRKTEQQTIHGGRRACGLGGTCPSGQCCSGGACYPIGTPGRLCEPPIQP